MSCETTQHAIKNCPYGSETLSLSPAHQVHLNSCAQCQEFAKDKALTNILKHVTHTTVPERWETKILAAARAKHKSPRLSVVWQYSAAASFVIAVALSVFLVVETSAPAPEISQVQLVVNEVKSVKFMLTSNNTLTGANINIALSDNVALAGFDGARKLSWTADIKQGNNLLELPVHLLHPVDGKIELQLEHEGSTKSYVINVSPRKDVVTNDETAVSI
jgi:hypothetical protein